MTAPASLAPDMLVGAAEIARFIFNSDEFRFQRRVYYLVTSTKRPLPHFRIGARIAARRSTLMDWIAMQEGLARAE